MQQKKEIKVIPPDPKYDRSVRVEQKILNVAAHCRVSTRYEQQENSFEAQVNYFTEKLPLTLCGTMQESIRIKVKRQPVPRQETASTICLKIAIQAKSI